MSAAEPSSRLAGFAARVVGMLLRPRATWEAVAAEPPDARALFLAYVAPLAAIGPICSVLGLELFGAGIAGIHLKPALAETLVSAAGDYAGAPLIVYLLAWAVSALAPAFGGEADCGQALKLVANSGTAVWVAGLFALYPTLGFPLGVLGGLYSLYALYLGLGPLMRPAPDRTMTYFAVVLAIALALALVLHLASGRLG